MNFRKSVKRVLLDRGLTQDWLADKLGINKSGVSALVREGASPNGDTIEKVARALNMKPSELIAVGED